VTGLVVAVSCSKSKLDYPAPARLLYTGACFRKSVRHAEGRGLPWFVLSSLHGVVLPDQVVAPYSFTPSRNGAALAGEPEGVLAGSAHRAEWAAKARVAVAARWGGWHFLALLGSEYLPALEGQDYEWPWAKMKLGPRLHWLDERRREWEYQRGQLV
jgi:hypothetical protein